VREAAETLKPVSESERENDLSFSHSNKGSSGKNKGAIKNKVVSICDSVIEEVLEDGAQRADT